MVARQSYENMRKTSQLSGEKIKLSDIRTNVVQHLHEYCATVVRIKIKKATFPGKSCDYCMTVARFIFKIRPKFVNLSHKCLFNETAT